MPEFLGKNVILTDDTRRSSYSELVAMLKSINVRDGLRELGRLFGVLDKQPTKCIQLGGALIPSFAIPPLALELILASDDTQTGQMDSAALSTLVQLFQALPAAKSDGDGALETMLRMGRAQFSFQTVDRYRLPRTARIFADIWKRVPQASKLDINQATQASFGGDLEATLLLGLVFAERARQGHVSPYPSLNTDHPVHQLFTPEAQLRFLNALSLDYSDFRKRARPPPSEDLRSYRFNPLALYPFILPDVQPSGKRDPVFLAPCCKFVLDRVTDGLVLDCRKRFGGEFNDVFGIAVEKYVGSLLLEAYGEQSVRGEFHYRVKSRKLLSPDWTVQGGKRAIVIEVKKTLLTPDAHSFGKMQTVRDDLQRNLRTAVRQLSEFRFNLRWLTDYPPAHDIEFVVVTWDDHWWTNSLLMDQVRIPDGIHVHLMSVRELERLLAYCDSPVALYELLWAKRYAGAHEAKMDMGDWLARLPGTEPPPLASLARAQDEFLSRWHITFPNGGGELTGPSEESP